MISLELVDPRFYHLDTALAVLDDTTIAYYPPAFSDVSRAQLETLFPDAIVVDTADAYALGLNAVSDGRHVVHPAAAAGFARATGRRRFRAHRRRAVRAAQGRRIRQVLHAGVVLVTPPETTDGRRRDRAAIALTSAHARTTTRRCPWWPPAPRACWITDVEGRRYLDCLAAYSAVNFGHRNPRSSRRPTPSSTRSHWSVARFTPKARAVLRGAADVVRQGHGAADEQRRRGGRERPQGGA